MKTLSPKRVAILGCGFTGVRVAQQLLATGCPVLATTRDPNRLQLGGLQVVRFDALERGGLDRLPTLVENCRAIVCSIPTLRLGGELVERVPAIVDRLRGVVPQFIYLSTTGVYGAQERIDAITQPQPSAPREKLRVWAETAVLEGFENALVLRPAAIYGPGRGVHVSIREGRYRLTGNGMNYVSRIHVDDLAMHVVAALESDVTGAWPVADEHPCTQREMAAFCANLLNLPLPSECAPGEAPETLRANRRVDGSAIRARLGISLRYPSYREGVTAAIAEERRVAKG